VFAGRYTELRIFAAKIFPTVENFGATPVAETVNKSWMKKVT